MARSDVLVIGGGVMGCGAALALAREKVDVTVLEKSVVGAEASSKAAGILGAQVEAHAPDAFFDLCLASRALFPELAARLLAESAIDIEYRCTGVLRIPSTEAEAEELATHGVWQREMGQRVERVSSAELRTRWPTVAPTEYDAVFFPDDARIDPPRYLAALRISAERAGARFATGSPVKRIVAEKGVVRGVALEDGSLLETKVVVIAAGSWSALVGDGPLVSGAIVPARGQIVELTQSVPPFDCVVWGRGAYLSPRDDGRVLVGSTMELVGFRPGVTAAGVRDLLIGATALVPQLESAEVARTWSSFRPYTKNTMPFIGRSSIEGVLLATGHFRNGILLSAITSQAIAALVIGREPPMDLSPFAPT